MVILLKQPEAALLLCISFVGFGTAMMTPENNAPDIFNPEVQELKTAAEFKDLLTSEATNTPKGSASKLINPEGCGIPGLKKRIYGGQEADLGAYPWLALLGYEKEIPILDAKNQAKGFSKGIAWNCGGALINMRYVMTAAHCYYFDIVKARLGEHNLATDPDCIGNDQRFCAEPVQEFTIEEVIMHEDHNKPKMKHDIALVRLNRDAIFSDWVYPICLPNYLTMDLVGEKLTVAGWGKTEYARDWYDKLIPVGCILLLEPKCRSCKTLMEVQKLVLKMEDCMDAYPFFNITKNNQICAGGIGKQDTCEGDSGSPLILEVEEDVPRFYAMGVTSLGAITCGIEEPAIYTNVHYYMPWIESKLRPW